MNEEREQQTREVFESILAKKPSAMFIVADVENTVAIAAVGSEVDLQALAIVLPGVAAGLLKKIRESDDGS